MDYRDVRPCPGCGEHPLKRQSGLHFYRMTVEICILDARRAQQHIGLTMMMGQAAPVADVLGDPDLFTTSEMRTMFVCVECMERRVIAELLEAEGDDAD